MSPSRKATSVQARQPRRRGPAFTLIELLVVVAIIALLISILLPSLSKARAQARGTLCASRISQLTKAILLYADDYDETPPFLGIGWENIRLPDEPDTDALADETPRPPSALLALPNRYEWAVAETWLTQHPELLWQGLLPEEDWATNDPPVGVRTGDLFAYTRFEKLYRCPEFERQAGASQNQFNYTRNILGRKWIMGEIAQGGQEPDYWGSSVFGAAGPIVKISQVYSPSRLWMFIDEWWWRHVGAPFEQHESQRETLSSGGWSANDCIHFALLDEINRAHGQPVSSPFVPTWLEDQRIQRGFVGCYDGHAELEREFWADKSDQPESILFVAAGYIVNWLSAHTYAQRGKVIIGMPGG